ncbi:MAG TPA: YcnI family protein, partial [Mycobacterium sp.]|nr:YcnI family protein [Mycobacterium sp.]
MTPPRRIVWRTLIGTVAATLLYLGPAAAITTASAHVQATSTDAARGAFATVSFQVPNESTTNAATTAVTVDLTNVSAVQTEAKPGWSAKIDRDAATNAVRSVTWTAAPDAGISVDQFGVFRISAKLPDADTVSFPTTQTYSDGVAVKWDQASAPGGAEPEHPAPTLTLAGGPTPLAQNPTPTKSATPTATSAPSTQQSRVVDNTARIL